MNIAFLGTSSAVPTKTRNVTGNAIREEQGNAWYLVDCGEGTQDKVIGISTERGVSPDTHLNSIKYFAKDNLA